MDSPTKFTKKTIQTITRQLRNSALENAQEIHNVQNTNEEQISTDECEEDDPRLKEWKNQFDGKLLSPSDIKKQIYKSNDAGATFRLNFAILFVNLVCEQNKPVCLFGLHERFDKRAYAKSRVQFNTGMLIRWLTERKQNFCMVLLEMSK
ncbi:hypothetical protein LXL04_022840 [Taraxacum kok-saghyz]